LKGEIMVMGIEMVNLKETILISECDIETVLKNISLGLNFLDCENRQNLIMEKEIIIIVGETKNDSGIYREITILTKGEK
jgi:hypothetical protein